MLDVEGLKERLSSRALAQWMAYASIEPFGEERADLRAGIIASVIANVNRDRKKRSEPFSPQDFMPQFGERTPETQPIDADTLTAQVKAMLGHPKAKPLKRKKGR